MTNAYATRSEELFVAFIRILYAVVFGQALFSLGTSLNLPVDWRNFFSEHFLFFAFSVILVMRDWVQYHDAIKIQPHKTFFRFVIDILILFAFFFMFQVAIGGGQDNATQTMKPLEVFAFAAVVTGYRILVLIWELIESYEYKDQSKAVLKAIWFTVFSIALFATWTAISWRRPDAWIGIIFFLVFLVGSSWHGKIRRRRR